MKSKESRNGNLIPLRSRRHQERDAELRTDAFRCQVDIFIRSSVIHSHTKQTGTPAVMSGI